MNPHLQTITLDNDESFSIQLEMGLGLYKQWHYHREIELIYIIRGSGTRFIGDRVDNFKDDEMILIGSNVPHMMRTDQEYDQSQPDEVLVIHFLPEILNFFLEMPENKAISTLFSNASHGINIYGDTLAEVKKLIYSIRFARNSERIIMLLQILNALATSKDTELVSHTSFGSTLNKSDENRLNKIYHYTLNNFAKEISLQQVADIVHLCPHSFCRYFRSRTKKRYSAFLMEIRLSHACKLLSETDYSISVVSYESGFMNLSNFNRHFKVLTGKTPLEYRKHFHTIRAEHQMAVVA
jgi:AraC-like DNA-binding protein